jgi:hypothetical protein
VIAVRIAVLALLLAVAMPSAAADREVVLVVSADSPVTGLEAIEIRKLFLGLPVLRENRPLHPVRNVSDEQLSQVFLQHVVAMSQSAYDRRILSQMLQQGRPRPIEVKTRDQVIAALGADPLAVSYMWRKDLPPVPRLRILRVLWTD